MDAGRRQDSKVRDEGQLVIARDSVLEFLHHFPKGCLPFDPEGDISFSKAGHHSNILELLVWNS